MPVSQDSEGTPHFGFLLSIVPTGAFPEAIRQFLDHWTSQLAQVSQQGAAQNKIIQMDDFLALRHFGDLGRRVIRVSL